MLCNSVEYPLNFTCRTHLHTHAYIQCPEYTYMNIFICVCLCAHVCVSKWRAFVGHFVSLMHDFAMQRNDSLWQCKLNGDGQNRRNCVKNCNVFSRAIQFCILELYVPFINGKYIAIIWNIRGLYLVANQNVHVIFSHWIYFRFFLS